MTHPPLSNPSAKEAAASPRLKELLATDQRLVQWALVALPGEQFVYHRGFLAIDTSATSSKLPFEHREVLQRIASRVAELATYGLVQAVQERLNDGGCAYIVIASKHINSVRSRVQRTMPELLKRGAP